MKYAFSIRAKAKRPVTRLFRVFAESVQIFV